MPDVVPRLRQVVLDGEDVRVLAEFYRQLLGWRYRPGDEPPTDGSPDERGSDWLVLRSPDGGAGLAFQQTARVPRTTWPDDAVPQQLHLDTAVSSMEELRAVHERALALGAELRLDRTDDEDEPLYVYADPAGHLVCVFVG